MEVRSETLEIREDFYDRLKELSRREGITLNSLLQFAWHKALSVYGQSCQTTVGVTVSGRNLPIESIEESVGLHINTLPLIVEHRPDQSIKGCLEEIQESLNNMNMKSMMSLAKLQTGGERLFDSLFVYENYPVEKSDNPLKVRFRYAVEKLDYPLAVIAYETPQSLVFKLNYAGEIITVETIKQLLLFIEFILRQVVEDIHQKVGDLSYLVEEEKRLLSCWNETRSLYEKESTLDRLFEGQVEKSPDSVAVIYEDFHLTYGFLNEKSNQLADYLRVECGVKLGDSVALCLERSERMLIGILGIFFWHTFINMSMVSGMMPIVGVPLPMMSYGGSSLLTYGTCIGILTSISNNRSFFN